MGSKIRKPKHLKSRQMGAILLKTIWNPEKNVRILNGPTIAIAIAKAQPFENQTI